MRLIILFLLLAKSVTLLAQDEFSTQSVTVFKTGQAFYHQQSEVSVSNGKIDSLIVPKTTPALGTVGFHCFDNVINSYRTYDGEVKKTEKAVRFGNPRSMYAANIGKEIELTLKEGDRVKGTIESVHNLGSTDSGKYQLMLKVGSSYRLISSGQIVGFALGDNGVERRTTTKTETSRLLSFDLQQPATSATIELTYLTDQLTWVPQYQAELMEDQRIKLNLFATILNDRESLDNVRLNLAVGQPEFVFSRMNDPLFDRQTVRNFLNQLNNRRRVASDSPVMMQNVITSQRASVMADANLPATSNALNEADLYFFNIQNFSLDKGHTAKVRLLELEAEYTDIYTCNLNTRNGAGNTYKVKHAIRLQNTSPHPLTTGIVMFHSYDDEKGFEPLGQQQLDFIAPGATGQVPLGIATDVSVDQAELTGPLLKDEKRDKYYQDKTVTFKLSNYKDKTVTIRLRRSINGYLTSSEIEAKNVSNGLMDQRGQPHFYDRSNNYEWEVELKPGERKEMQAEFRVWQ
ncbi:MAG: DUF4139 domain-containing protein [Bacteroidota bacterium]